MNDNLKHTRQNIIIISIIINILAIMGFILEPTFKYMRDYIFLIILFYFFIQGYNFTRWIIAIFCYLIVIITLVGLPFVIIKTPFYALSSIILLIPLFLFPTYLIFSKNINDYFNYMQTMRGK